MPELNKFMEAARLQASSRKNRCSYQGLGPEKSTASIIGSPQSVLDLKSQLKEQG